MDKVPIRSDGSKQHIHTGKNILTATSKRGRRISNDNDAMVYSLHHEPMKRRRLDLGDIMVKTTGLAKPISDKPVEQFWTVRQPELTRLAERPYATTSGKQKYGTEIWQRRPSNRL
jgi:hypothetical protein